MPHHDPQLELQHPPEQGTVLAPAVARGGRVASAGRSRVLRTITDSPGLGFRELARRTGIAAGTLAHHMAVLQRAGSVWTMPHGSRVLHFPAPRLDAPVPNPYPMGAMDMFYTHPELRLAKGGIPRQAEVVERHVERDWRRFSWHYNRPWNPAVDDLVTHVSFCEQRLAEAAHE